MTSARTAVGRASVFARKQISLLRRTLTGQRLPELLSVRADPTLSVPGKNDDHSPKQAGGDPRVNSAACLSLQNGNYLGANVGCDGDMCTGIQRGTPPRASQLIDWAQQGETGTVQIGVARNPPLEHAFARLLRHLAHNNWRFRVERRSTPLNNRASLFKQTEPPLSSAATALAR